MTSEKRIVEKEVYIAYDGKEFDNDVICLRYEKEKQALEHIKCRKEDNDKIIPLIQCCRWDEKEEKFYIIYESFNLLSYFYATTDYEKDLVNDLANDGDFFEPYESFDFDLVYWDADAIKWKPFELKINKIAFDLAKYNTIAEEFENDW